MLEVGKGGTIVLNLGCHYISNLSKHVVAGLFLKNHTAGVSTYLMTRP